MVEERREFLGSAVEEAKRRCRAVEERIEKGFNNLSLLTQSCKRTLLRLVRSELSFLSRVSLSSHNDPNPNSNFPLSVNIGHLEAVVYILQQPLITGVSRVCKPISQLPAVQNGPKDYNSFKGIHVDIVCTLNGNPVWFLVSDRNPKYISWHGYGSCKNKGLKLRIEHVLDAARSSITLKPSSVILFFSNELKNSLIKDLRDEFGATDFKMNFSCFDCGFSDELEGEWVDVIARSFRKASVFEIKVDQFGADLSSRKDFGVKDSLLGAARPNLSAEDISGNLGDSFCSLISKISFSLKEFSIAEDFSSNADLLNFDTTALIAIVSGISNGHINKLLATPEDELRGRFKSNFEFVIAQIMSEVQNPIHIELVGVISGKGGIICDSVSSEFKELVLMCGGPNEKLRASQLLKHLMVVPDSPSTRMMSLPTTRKLALKNKVVFGTGDYWHAPTLTANMAFVRAVSQTGMSLFTIEHRPRALTGD